ncbi:MAG: LysE family translocator [Hoeflea sp.]|uniref:LysE family translocator n=1 Tax=Hoeflea sp. TaxID=1940281 RepID=UPI001E03BBEA|nr:LysE family translocator [Hoeflea sp.]MBU4530216.1 LysE family translocator [Alphaproteobacteria bacterium]MBU4542499.1 LysE family translocator [Alphaproteobacteria bacterium]MBU4551180.1 LysE family translocator [Alphaproteobacteria bacterium]MBV1723003.1 LysE family translocator [Hoeflea sp.]MBV1760014.1 LysE family translocator [Hoeflea sp.]
MQWTIAFVGVFAIFIPALMLPGPDFIAVVRSSMARGTRAGLLTTLGVTLGLGFYAGLSLLGLSAILIQYQWLAWAVRICGGLYLAWLGFRLLMTKPTAIEIDGGDPGRSGNPFAFGFLVTLTNPKAIVLFTSVFATAVTDAMPLWVMGMMIGLVMLSSATWYTLVTLFMSSRPVIARFQNARHWIERAAGVCFVAIGGKILADSRNPITP